ncbi:MAG: cytoskeleton protein RodZ [Thiomicrorhabdus sp.]|nr:MAG: cytoskeleton protein RodZ [Thiomicrorhabdus sp.]
MASESEVTVVEVPLNELFIKSREAKGLSLDTVASQLNMSVEQLEKLEGNSFNPTNLTIFERGYVRNYAALLEIESDVFELYFPESNSVCSELHSVQRYSGPANKPLFNTALFKGLFAMGIAGLIVLLVWINMPVLDRALSSAPATEKSIGIVLEKPRIDNKLEK